MCESAENYLKTILLLQRKLGVVRSVDVANERGVSRPSVCNAVKKLQANGMVAKGKDHTLLLTERGERQALSILERHTVIERFLIDELKVDRQTAHRDSCQLEHLLSEETVARLRDRNKTAE